MTKLSDTQLVLLSAASQRADGVIPISERLRGGVATAVAGKLIALGLAEERVALPPLTGWRENAEGQRLALVITCRGLAAIGIEDVDGAGDPNDAATSDTPAALAPAPDRAIAPTIASTMVPTPASKHIRSPVLDRDVALQACDAVRARTKKALVIGLLQQQEGASIDDIVARTGWLPHTTRAALTGLRKRGMQIETVRQAGCATRYRITSLSDGAGA